MLQNRYGDHEFPVRDRWSNARRYRLALVKAHPRRTTLRNLAALVPALVLLAVVAVVTDGFEGGSRTAQLAGLVGFACFALLVAAALVGLNVVDRRGPRRDQERYWAAIGARPVTPRQQQLLALDAQSDFDFGGWNSSLDYGPAWSRMPAEAQRRHEREPAWQPFPSMPLLETDRLRAQLDQQWHIASAPDLELAVADLHAERSLTARFAAVLAGADGERMLARVASLTGADQWDLRALVEPSADGWARGLRAADAQRTVALVRMGWLAGHLDEDTAWRLVERAAGPATGLFASWDDYWANVRIGTAFGSDRLDAVQRFDRSLAGLRASAWPAASAAFPSSPIPVGLPRTAPEPTDPRGV